MESPGQSGQTYTPNPKRMIPPPPKGFLPADLMNTRLRDKGKLKF